LIAALATLRPRRLASWLPRRTVVGSFTAVTFACCLLLIRRRASSSSWIRFSRRLISVESAVSWSDSDLSHASMTGTRVLRSRPCCVSFPSVGALRTHSEFSCVCLAGPLLGVVSCLLGWV
jgi:hypothetical protein